MVWLVIRLTASGPGLLCFGWKPSLERPDWTKHIAIARSSNSPVFHGRRCYQEKLHHAHSPPDTRDSTSITTVCHTSGNDTARGGFPGPRARYGDGLPRGSEDRRRLVACAWTVCLLSRGTHLSSGSNHALQPRQTEPASSQSRASSAITSLSWYLPPPTGVVDPGLSTSVEAKVNRVLAVMKPENHGRGSYECKR